MAETGESLLERIRRFVSLKGTKQIRTPDNVSDGKGNIIANDTVVMAVVDDNDEANAPTKYESNDLLQSFYPTNPIDTTQVITVTQLTASALAADYQPTAGYINDIQLIFFDMSATAAGRDLYVYVTDGTSSIPIYESGAGGLASGVDGIIFPWDQTAIYMPATQAWGFPLITHAATYLNFTNTDLTAAETIDVYVHAKIMHVEGL